MIYQLRFLDVCYGCYITYRSLYQVMITIAQFNIAKKMVCESFSLVFGINSFVALIMQSTIMMIVADKRGMGLPVRQQYVIYAALHFFIAIIFAVSVTYSIISYLCRTQKIVDNSSSSSEAIEHESDAMQIIERKASRKSSRVEPLELQVQNVERDAENAEHHGEFSADEFDSDYDDLSDDDKNGTMTAFPGATPAASFSASFSK